MTIFEDYGGNSKKCFWKKKPRQNEYQEHMIYYGMGIAPFSGRVLDEGKAVKIRKDILMKIRVL